MDPLDALAEAVGIEPGYHDIWHNQIVATAEQKRRMLAAMGVAAHDAQAQRVGGPGLLEDPGREQELGGHQHDEVVDVLVRVDQCGDEQQ